MLFAEAIEFEKQETCIDEEVPSRGCWLSSLKTYQLVKGSGMTEWLWCISQNVCDKKPDAVGVKATTLDTADPNSHTFDAEVEIIPATYKRKKKLILKWLKF